VTITPAPPSLEGGFVGSPADSVSLVLWIIQVQLDQATRNIHSAGDGVNSPTMHPWTRGARRPARGIVGDRDR
jgi:hypothetical protein